MFEVCDIVLFQEYVTIMWVIVEASTARKLSQTDPVCNAGSASEIPLSLDSDGMDAFAELPETCNRLLKS